MSCKVEMCLNGRWLWIVQLDFATHEEAEAYIARVEKHDRAYNQVQTPYRIVETKDEGKR